MLSNKTPYGKEGAHIYYFGYLSGSFRPLCIVVKEIKLYNNHMNISANNKEFLKYVELWNKYEVLFNEKFNKRGLYNRPVYNKYVKNKINLHNENFHGNKKLLKDEYYGHPILLIESICEAGN